MAENVFILGAGASFDAGAPLMKNFLDTAEDLLIYGDIPNRSDFTEVFKVINELQSVYAKSYIDTNNIESLFGAIEMALVINRLGERKGEKIQRARDALVNLIVTTLEYSIHFSYRDQLQPTSTYQHFVQTITSKGISSSILSFNYDCALDIAFEHNSVFVDYGLPNQLNMQYHNAIHYYKLHGSTNWAACSNKDCNLIFPVDRQILGSRKPQHIIFSSRGIISSATCPKCNSKAEHTPVIVPPTWNKNQYQGSLSDIWTKAANELSEARNIFVIGYSLPVTDSFFRYLFALGTVGTTRIRNFIVIDPSDGQTVTNRYGDMLGKAIWERFEHKRMTFAEGVRVIGEYLK